MTMHMNEQNGKYKYNFLPIGEAIKNARKARKLSRQYVSGKVDLEPRYLMSIENSGQHPSFQKFYELITMFDISVDEYFYPEKAPEKSTRRRRLEAALDSLDEQYYAVLETLVRNLIDVDLDKNTNQQQANTEVCHKF